MKAVLFALMAMVTLAVPACGTIIGDPANIEGALPSETNELRVIRASLIVSGAYDTLVEQLDKGLITPEEAVSAKAVVDRTSEAVKVASIAVELEDASVEEQLAYVDTLILAILQSQALEN